MPEQERCTISILVELTAILILKCIEIAVADELLFLVKDANTLFFSVIRIDGRVLVLVDKVLRGGRINFSHTYSKNKGLRASAYLSSNHRIPAAVRSPPWTK